MADYAPRLLRLRPRGRPQPSGIPGLTAMQASGHPYPEADKEELHKLDYLPPAPLPKEEKLAGTDGIFVPFTEQIQDRMKEIKVQKED